METLLQDLRYALRQFVRRPGFTAIAVISLALAIGGNSLIYGIIDGFGAPVPLSRPRSPGRSRSDLPPAVVGNPLRRSAVAGRYADIRTNRAFSSSAAFDLGNRNISGGNVPERVFTALLLDDLFPVVAMRPMLGRGFTREELAPNGPPVAIISHRLWQTRFGGIPLS